VTEQPRPLIGAHVKVAGGLASRGLQHAREVGAEALQVFVSNPRGWALAAGDSREDAAFIESTAAARIPVLVHTPYLVNLGSPTAATFEQSRRSIEHSLRRAAALGAAGVVIHSGSAVDRDHRKVAIRQVREGLLPLLEAIPDGGPYLLLEPMAGQGESLCATVSDVGEYFAALDDHPRLGVCLDTCHAYAAGHDLATTGGVTATLDELIRTVGAGRLRAVHANDSKDRLGSGRDRHENIGAGHLGRAAFAELIAHPAVRGIPVLIETPGDRASDAKDISILKDLREHAAGARPAAAGHRARANRRVREAKQRPFRTTPRQRADSAAAGRRR
jgi:deoxyribonuclease IV